MRRLVFLVLLIALGWMGYWAIGAVALDRGLSGWFNARQAEGWVAEYADISVSGFPVKFDVSIDAPELADPATGVAWSAPEFRFQAASMRPTEITAVWPRVQTFASPFERITVEAEVMAGTVGFAPNTALALRSSDVRMIGVDLTSSLGWTAGLRDGRLTTVESDLGSDAHRIVFSANDLLLADPLKRSLDPAGALPQTVSVLSMTADVAFDAAWDRFAIERARPQITALDLEDLRATWGELDLRAAGALSVDADGVPSGRITIKAVNWREMLDIAEATGALPAQLIPTIERALEVLADLSGPPDTLDAPLTFRDGFVLFGPIPLGPAPRLTIR